jgi:hypothetical protein
MSEDKRFEELHSFWIAHFTAECFLTFCWGFAPDPTPAAPATGVRQPFQADQTMPDKSDWKA